MDRGGVPDKWIGLACRCALKHQLGVEDVGQLNSGVKVNRDGAVKDAVNISGTNSKETCQVD